MCTLISGFFSTETSSSVEAVKWLEEAAVAGHVRAQYSFALCLQQGRGVECNLPRAVSDQSDWTVRHKVHFSPKCPSTQKIERQI